MNKALLIVLLVPACGGGTSSDTPDAAPAPDSFDLPPGDFSCIDTPWPTDAPDPVHFAGQAVDIVAGGSISAATVELHAAADDTLLATASTNISGAYGIDLATGGTAPIIYRKAFKSGRLDGYAFDPIPVSVPNPSMIIPLLTDSERDQYATAAGVAPDPAKALLYVMVYDCAGQPVPGAVVTVPGADAVLYVNADHLVDANAIATSTDGGALVVNVPAGPVDVTITARDYTYRAWGGAAYGGAVSYLLRMP